MTFNDRIAIIVQCPHTGAPCNCMNEATQGFATKDMFPVGLSLIMLTEMIRKDWDEALAIDQVFQAGRRSRDGEWMDRAMKEKL